MIVTKKMMKRIFALKMIEERWCQEKKLRNHTIVIIHGAGG